MQSQILLSIIYRLHLQQLHMRDYESDFEAVPLRNQVFTFLLTAFSAVHGSASSPSTEVHRIEVL